MALVLIFLLPVIVSAASAEYREVPVKLTVQVDGMGASVDMGVTLHPGEVMRVDLTAASGTGYAWQLTEETRLVKVAGKAGPQPLTADKAIVGGPYCETYMLQAGEEAGMETVRFVLARPWEDKGKAAKELTIAITIR